MSDEFNINLSVHLSELQFRVLDTAAMLKTLTLV